MTYPMRVLLAATSRTIMSIQDAINVYVLASGPIVPVVGKVVMGNEVLSTSPIVAVPVLGMVVISPL